MEYSIQEVAKAAGTTSRTLRHYDEIGLLRPSRVGQNGYRYYDNGSLVRLQRVLLLRQLGLGLGAIREVLDAQDAGRNIEPQRLNDHLELLREEQRRLATQVRSVERTIAALTNAGSTTQGAEGADLMAENIFDGFDHTQYREEVEQRWGRDAYSKSDRWWRELGEAGRTEWKDSMQRLGSDWIAAAENHTDPTSPAAQELAERQVEWLRAIPGTPAHANEGGLADYLLNLGEMYVADERFAANYGGKEGARFVRDALRVYVESNLR